VKKTKHKHMGHPVTPLVAIGIGIGTTIIISLLMSTVTAWLVSTERLTQNAIGGSTFITQLISTFIGCMIALILAGNMPAIVGTACAGGYFAFLLCVNVLIFDASLGGIGKGCVAILAGGALALLICLFRGKNRSHKKRRVYSR